jgi:hypothetical protein
MEGNIAMRRLKVIVVAATVALAISAALAAQAGPLGMLTALPQKASLPGTKKPADPPSGPIGTPGSDKTIKAHVEALEKAVAILKAQVADLQTRVATIEANNALELGPFVLVKDGGDNDLPGPNIFFKGANIHIVSGSGATDDGGATPLGLGNLIIGYDEPPASLNAGDRGGSHNLVIGPGHKFLSFGGFVAGANNIVSGADASVAGGENNTASGAASVVVGGNGNSATATDQIKP